MASICAADAGGAIDPVIVDELGWSSSPQRIRFGHQGQRRLAYATLGRR